MEDKKVFKPTIWDKKILLGGCLLFIVVSYFILIFPSDNLFDDFFYTLIGFASILFFGLASLVILIRGLIGRPFLTVSKEGVKIFKHTKTIFVPWKEVRKVRILPQGPVEHIGLFPFEERRSSNLSKAMDRDLLGLKEDPIGLISNAYFSFTNVDIIEAFHKYHNQFLATLSENEREKYVDVIPQIVDGEIQVEVRELKNTDEFGSGNEESTADFIDWESIMNREK